MHRHVALRGGLSAATAAILTICLSGASTAAEAQSSTAAGHVAASAQTANKAKFYAFGRPKHVKSVPEICGKTVIAEASGRGPLTLRIDETSSQSTTYSRSFSVNYESLTAAVGWDITKSRSITISGAKDVARGKYGVLKAYTRYSGKQFDVYRTVIPFERIAKGVKAYKPIGVCYAYTAR